MTPAITYTTLCVLFIMCAAISKAIADTLKDHYGISVFASKNPRFWNPDVSWKYAKFLPLTKYHADAWHLANSAMIVCMCAAVALHRPVWWWWAELLIAGCIWNLTFNLFYNKILIINHV